MAELELVGIHADGEHIVLVDEEGQRHRLLIDDALRAAVRRDRPQLEQIRSEGLRPRDIQAMVRAGASAEEIAADAGVPIEQVRRYEGPALAEREHVVQRARALPLGREAGSPTLGDLVVDRLAARGVPSQQIGWDARRRGAEPWEVVARFVAGDREREATWQVDLAAGSAVAVDDESRWLSETDLGPGTPRRHLSAVRGARLYDVETDADVAPALAAVDAVIRDTRPRGLRPVEPAEPAEPEPVDVPQGDDTDTEALLDELSAARGVRQRLEIDDDALAAQVLADDDAADDDLEDGPAAAGPRKPTVLTPAPHTPALWDEEPHGVAGAATHDDDPDQEGPGTDDAPEETLDGAHPAASQPDEATDATVVRERPARRSQKNRRTSVPSWDEIVFGARSDQ
ncbi:septation protein SepH [Pseudactinotalea suaedae]|uniref:septation protein SepH n=1 Tax=Pseudactinotalea suaedae TaxID=1524924 RepID=UPI0012E0E63C|nr:septation protein SepH [Pseudactinotalea suaedae]